jgi:excisionase family DNA binding protein
MSFNDTVRSLNPPSTRGAEEWIGPAEVAARLKVSRATVYALVKFGQLRHRRVGLQIRVPISALDDFLKDRSEPPEHSDASRGRRLRGPLVGLHPSTEGGPRNG